VSFTRYSLIVLAATYGSLAVVLPLFGAQLDASARAALLLGGTLAAANALAAYAIALWSEGRSHLSFLRAVLGGMLGRMGALLAAVVAGVLWLGLPKLPLVFSLLGYFVVFLVLELGALHKRTAAQAQR
jgi:hypothetical protein